MAISGDKSGRSVSFPFYQLLKLISYEKLNPAKSFVALFRKEEDSQ